MKESRGRARRWTAAGVWIAMTILSVPVATGAADVGIWGIELATPDMAASVGFYQRLGFEVVPVGQYATDVYLLRNGEVGLVLSASDRQPPARDGPRVYLNLRVGDLDAAARAVATAGGRIEPGPPIETPVGQMLRVTDPAGHPLNLIDHPGDELDAGSERERSGGLDAEPAAASCPYGTLNPEAPEETSQFAFLIGEWSCSIRRLQRDGRLGEPTLATWTGRYILDGWAIQDDWVSTDAQGRVSHGLNIRSFNHESGKWDNRWLEARSRRWLYFEAEMIGESMVMTSDPRRDAAGRPYLARNTFHDISANSWSWRQDRSFDGGATWLEGVAVIEARLNDGCGSRTERAP